MFEGLSVEDLAGRAEDLANELAFWAAVTRFNAVGGRALPFRSVADNAAAFGYAQSLYYVYVVLFHQSHDTAKQSVSNAIDKKLAEMARFDADCLAGRE